MQKNNYVHTERYIRPFLLAITIIITSLLFVTYPLDVRAAYHFSDFKARPPIHVHARSKTPQGVTPTDIKKIYKLPASGGKGTIIIIGAYSDTAVENDLADFDAAFKLPICSTTNGCFKRHFMGGASKSGMTGNSSNSPEQLNWELETALDVEWAHAIAPKAKILLVEAVTSSGANLLSAIDYAAQQKGVRAIAMSWGGTEFPEETNLDSHFVSVSGATFFASSGDSGAGVSWPSASPRVVGVGGTSLVFGKDGSFKKERAWQGSGGGVSAFESAPPFQTSYSIPRSNGMRAVPDVAYDADPATGFPVVHNGTWHLAGGTSAGAPQWAAIAALGTNAWNENFYADKSSSQNGSFFRDIVSGINGTCGYYCKARKRYDYVTGLGTPQTVHF